MCAISKYEVCIIIMEHSYICRKCLEEEWSGAIYKKSVNVRREYHEAPLLEDNKYNKEQPHMKKQLQNYYRQLIEEQIQQKSREHTSEKHTK